MQPSPQEPITIEVAARAPIEKVWNDFTDPEAIKVWNAASEDWHTPRATNDLRVGGRFFSRMEARDGSEGFDFAGTYDVIEPYTRFAYVMDDGRRVEVVFKKDGEAVRVIETIDPEHENPREMQRDGWQSILNNFKAYVEAQS